MDIKNAENILTSGNISLRVGAPNTPVQSFTSVQIEEIDSNLFRGKKEFLWKPLGARGVYGGQVIGQALASAMRTVDQSKSLHSMHGYFLRKGDHSQDLIFNVIRLRDGTSFSSRMVTAQQEGKAIFVLMASFQKPDPGHLVHAEVMPKVPEPEGLPTENEYYSRLSNDPRCPDQWRQMLMTRSKYDNPIDMRPVVTADLLYEFGPQPADGPRFPLLTSENRHVTWIRCKTKLSDDISEHFAVLAYASDFGLLGAAKGHIPPYRLSMIASLDHSMWFHAPFRADEWLLYVTYSPRSNDGRGLSFGYIFRADGTLVVSVAQEGVIRLQNKMASEKAKEVSISSGVNSNPQRTTSSL